VKTAKPLHRAGVHNGRVRTNFIYNIFLDFYKHYLGTGVYRLDQIDTKQITTEFIAFLT
jgi:hypothetical protein